MYEYIKNRALTPEQAAIPLDHPTQGPEFSVRIMNLAVRHGVSTVGEIKEELDSGRMGKYWKGIGRKSINEIKDYLAHLTRPTGDLFEDPEYVAYQMEDKLGSVMHMLSDVQSRMLRAALKGCVSKEQRGQMVFLLRDAAERLALLPIKGEA